MDRDRVRRSRRNDRDRDRLRRDRDRDLDRLPLRIERDRVRRARRRDRDRERFRLERDRDRDLRTRTTDLDLLRLRRIDRDRDLLFLVYDRDLECRFLLEVERDRRFLFGLALWRDEERALLLGFTDSRLTLNDRLRLFLTGLGRDASLLVFERDRDRDRDLDGDLDRLLCFSSLRSSCFPLVSAVASASVLGSSSRSEVSSFGIISGRS